MASSRTLARRLSSAARAACLETLENRRFLSATTYNVADIGNLGGASGAVTQFNEAGDVAGVWQTNASTIDAFLSHNGVIHDITLGGSSSSISDLNNAGIAVGVGFTPLDAMLRGFITDGTTTTHLTLGGDNSNAVGINNSGQVAGSSEINGEQHVFLYQNGNITDLGTLGGGVATAADISDSGNITGESLNGDGATNAFLYSGSGLQDLGNLGGNFSSGVKVNNAGWVTGFSTNGDGESHAFLWNGSTMIHLGTLGGTGSGGTLINGVGQVVGFSSTAGDENTRAFFYDGSSMIELTLDGSNSSALDLNEAGDVVGVSDTLGDLSQHGFFFHNGQTIDLSFNGEASTAEDVNNNGVVVGTAQINGVDSAFVYQNGQMTDLNTLLPANSGWQLEDATKINDAGQITGTGIHNGVRSVFVLTAAPANQPPVVIISGLPANLVEGGSATAQGSTHDQDNNDTTGNFSLSWSVSLNNQTYATGSGTSFVFNPNDNGIYTVTLTATDGNGSTQAQQNVSVSNTAPTASISGIPASSAEGTAVSFGAGATDASSVDQSAGFTFAWEISKNNVVVSTNPNFTPNDNGTYVVKLTATDKDGGSSSTQQNLIVTNVAPAPSINGLPASVQTGTPVSISGTATDPSSADTTAGFGFGWQVLKNNVVVSTGSGANFTFTPATAGAYVVILTATDKDSGTGTTQSTLNVTAAPPVNHNPVANNDSAQTVEDNFVTISVLSNDTDQDAGQTLSVTGATTPAHGTVVINANGTIKYTPAHNYRGPDSFTYSISDGNGGTSSATVAVTVISPAQAITNSVNAVMTDLVTRHILTQQQANALKPVLTAAINIAVTTVTQFNIPIATAIATLTRTLNNVAVLTQDDRNLLIDAVEDALIGLKT